MTKVEYIKRLSAALNRVNKMERDKYIAYYSEVIDDRMEEGFSEEAAVAGLESVEAAASRIVAEAQAQGNMKKGLSAGAIVAIVLGSLFVFFVVYTLLGLFTYTNIKGSSTTVLHSPVITEPDSSGVLSTGYVFHETTFPSEGQSFNLELVTSHIEIQPSDDADFHIKYYVGDDHPLELVQTTSSVTLKDPRTKYNYTDFELSNLFSRKTQEYTVTLYVPATASGELNIATVSGSVMLYGIITDSDLNIANVSGDITMDALQCRSLNIATVAGNLDVANTVTDDLNCAATSGNVELHNVTTGDINAANVSGNVKINNTSFTELYCNTVSGDLKGTLLGSPDDYRVSFTTLSGRNSLAGITERGSKFIEFASVSGSISLEFGE